MLINELGNNDLTVAAAAFSVDINENTNWNCYIAYNEYTDRGLWVADSVALIPMCDIYKSRDILIATDIVTASLLKELPINIRRFFYLWELEYIERPNFQLYSQYYNNKEYELISRSEKYKQILKRTWGLDTPIWEDFNYEQFQKLAGI